MSNEDQSKQDRSMPILVRLSSIQLGQLDEWRREQHDLPGRPEAIRRLLEVAFETPRMRPATPAKKI
jgi:hypothetical protein